MYLTLCCPMICSMTAPLTKQFFSWRLIRVESIAPAIIRSQLSSGLDTGIMPEVKTRKLVFTRQEWSGELFTKDRGFALKTAKSHIEQAFGVKSCIITFLKITKHQGHHIRARIIFEPETISALTFTNSITSHRLTEGSCSANTL